MLRSRKRWQMSTIFQKRLSIPGMPTSSKGTITSDKPSDPQSLGPPYNNATTSPPSFAMPNIQESLSKLETSIAKLKRSLASASASPGREDDAVRSAEEPKEGRGMNQS